MELVKVTTPEDSRAEHEALTQHAEAVLKVRETFNKHPFVRRHGYARYAIGEVSILEGRGYGVCHGGGPVSRRDSHLFRGDHAQDKHAIEPICSLLLSPPHEDLKTQLVPWISRSGRLLLLHT